MSLCHCLNDKTCDHIDGSCPGNLCAPGWKSRNCSIGRVYSAFIRWSRGQTDIYGLFCEFVVPPRKKKTWLLFSVRDMSWGLRNPCFSKFSVVSLLKMA